MGLTSAQLGPSGPSLRRTDPPQALCHCHASSRAGGRKSPLPASPGSPQSPHPPSPALFSSSPNLTSFRPAWMWLLPCTPQIPSSPPLLPAGTSAAGVCAPFAPPPRALSRPLARGHQHSLLNPFSKSRPRVAFCSGGPHWGPGLSTRWRILWRSVPPQAGPHALCDTQSPPCPHSTPPWPFSLQGVLEQPYPTNSLPTRFAQCQAASCKVSHSAVA